MIAFGKYSNKLKTTTIIIIINSAQHSKCLYGKYMWGKICQTATVIHYFCLSFHMFYILNFGYKLRGSPFYSVGVWGSSTDELFLTIQTSFLLLNGLKGGSYPAR